MRDSVQKNLRLTNFRFPNSEFRFSKPLFKKLTSPIFLRTRAKNWPTISGVINRSRQFTKTESQT